MPVIASDLQVSLPTVNRRTSAVVAARLVARGHVGALVVADDDGSPAAVVAPSEVLRLLLTADEGADTVGTLLDDDRARIGPIVQIDPDAGLVEVATRMAASRAHVAVVNGDPRSPRFILLPLVIDAILAARDDIGEGA
jgi:CBS domain-containing protein